MKQKGFIEQSKNINQGVLDEQKVKKKDMRYGSSIYLEVERMI